MKNRKRFLSLALALCLLVNLLPLGVLAEEIDPSEGTTVTEGTTAPTDASEGTTAPVEEPAETTAPAEEPEGTTAPAEEPEGTTAPAEEPEGTTAPAEEPECTTAPTEVTEETTAPEEEAEEDEEAAEEDSEESEESEEETEASEPENEAVAVTDETTNITVIAPGIQSVTVTVVEAAPVSDEYDVSITYSIQVTADDGTPYTGSALVKVPVPQAMRNAAAYYGNVDGDPVEVPMPVDGFFSIEVPHFSDLTISADLKEVNITLFVGQTYTVDDPTGNYENDDNNQAPGSEATMTVTGDDTTKKLVPVTDADSFVEGKSFVLENVRAKEGGKDYNLTSTMTHYQGWIPGTGLLMVTGTNKPEARELWSITRVGDTDTFSLEQGGQYLNLNPGTATMEDAEQGLTFDYIDGSWRIHKETVDGQDSENNDIIRDFYLDDLMGNEWDGAIANWDVVGQNYVGSNWNIYEVVAAPSTRIVFEAKSAGTTTAVINNVTYNITVNEYQTVDIVLYEGSSKTVTIEGHQYTDADVSTAPDASKARIDAVTPMTGTSSYIVSATPATTVKAGGMYLIESKGYGNVVTNSENPNGAWGYTVLRLQNNNMTANSTNIWILEAVDSGFKIKTIDGEYMNLGINAGSVDETGDIFQITQYDSTSWIIGPTNDTPTRYYLNNLGNNGYASAGGWTGDGSKWVLYEVTTETPDAYTEVTFTGVKGGTTTTAIVGNVKYNITVKALETGDIPGLDNIVGAGETIGGENTNGKVIKILDITAGSSFRLGVDLADYDSIEWTSADPSVATVDGNGLVTGQTVSALTTTTVTATVVKDGVRETISITVNVHPALGTSSNKRAIFFYISEVTNTSGYYTMFLESKNRNGAVPGYELVPVSEGQVLYLEHDRSDRFAIIWTAAPDPDHALAFMSATNSHGQYYALKTPEGNLGSGISGTANGKTQYYFVNNVEGAYKGLTNNWKNYIAGVLNTAIGKNNDTNGADDPDYNCNGAHGFNRGSGDGDVGTSLSFISNPLPEVEKIVRGIMPVNEAYDADNPGDAPKYLRKDFQVYQDGMTAAVDTLIYYTVTVTLERPNSWQDNAHTINTLEFSDAILYDFLDNDNDGTPDSNAKVYFYVQSLDEGLDGFVDEDKADEVSVTVNNVEYPVSFDVDGENGITTADLYKLNITAALNAPWAPDEQVRTLTFAVVYQIQEKDIDGGNIQNKVDLTFMAQSRYSSGSRSGASASLASMYVVGQPMQDIVIDFGLPVTITGSKEDAELYGIDADVTGRASCGDVDVQYNADGTFAITYTPNKILQGTDRILLVKTVGGEEKVVNSIIVYPATTVFYEEGFATLTGFTNPGTKGSGIQEYQATGQSGQNYGYTSAYVGNTGPSGGTQAESTTMGSATFQFTGTGVDIYANCDTDTGGIIVQVRDANTNQLMKFYRILTHTGKGTTEATAQQGVKSYSLPVFSVTDLPHATYKVTISHAKTGQPFYLDGFRVYNTMEIDPTSDYEKNIYVASEQFPTYVDIRDCVLAASGVENVIDSSQYKAAVDQVVSMVYSASESGRGAIVLSAVGNWDQDEVKDILDNGPKNEFFLWPGMSITFQLAENVRNNVQIGMKAFTGAGSVCTVNGAEITVNSTIDMFYDISTVDGKVVIMNTGENPISLTKLKIFGVSNPDEALAPVTEELVSYAMFRMVRPEVFTEAMIVRQPQDAFAVLNEEMAISMEAAGTGLTYQWYWRNAGDEEFKLSQCTTDTYYTTMSKARDGREIYCVVTDSQGNQVTSNVVTLKRVASTELAIVTQPRNSVAVVGEDMAVSLRAVGEGLTYQWYWRNAGAEEFQKSNCRTNTYYTTMNGERHGREIYCVITDALGNQVVSNVVTIRGTVSTKLTITAQPQDTGAPLYTEMAVSLNAVGDELTYQWYWRNTGEEAFHLSSCKTDTYYTTMTKGRDGREIYCVVTDALGNQITSEVVTLHRTAAVELEILSQPQNVDAVLGENIEVSVKAAGEGLRYQWYWRNAGGEEFQSSACKTNTYYTAMTKARDGREVYCVITDALGNQITTDVVTLRRVAAAELAIVAQPQDTTAFVNEEMEISLEAEGEGLRYQWYWRNAGAGEFQVSTCKTNTYYTTMNRERNGREIYCVITDDLGNQVVSDVVTLRGVTTVQLEILSQPGDASATRNQAMAISLKVAGEGLCYQWYWRNAGDELFKPSSCTTDTYYTTMTNVRDGREIYCVVTDALGNQVVSEVVTLRMSK